MACVSGSNLREIEKEDGYHINEHAHGVLEIDPNSLPLEIQENLRELEEQFNDDDITEKGFYKKRNIILAPFLKHYDPPKVGEELVEPELEKLPKTVLNALEVLQQELNNEEITEKGYHKKRGQLLQPYMLKEPVQEDLPELVQQQYALLEQELREEDITQKGFRKKKRKLLHPYLIPINPTFYAVKQEKGKNRNKVQHADPTDTGEPKKLRKRVTGIQQVTEAGEKVFKCKVCGEVFKSAQSFSGHCRLHRGERTKNFKCTFCTASYTTKSHLKFHMYKHTGDFPYSCSYCQKGFAGKSQLKYHELRHIGEAPHTCTVCHARFWKLENLSKHEDKGCEEGTNPIKTSPLGDNDDDDVYGEDEDITQLDDDDDDGLPSMTVSNGNDSNNNHVVSLPPPDTSCMLNSTIKMKPVFAVVNKD